MNSSLSGVLGNDYRLLVRNIILDLGTEESIRGRLTIESGMKLVDFYLDIFKKLKNYDVEFLSSTYLVINKDTGLFDLKFNGRKNENLTSIVTGCHYDDYLKFRNDLIKNLLKEVPDYINELRDSDVFEFSKELDYLKLMDIVLKVMDDYVKENYFLFEDELERIVCELTYGVANILINEHNLLENLLSIRTFVFKGIRLSNRGENEFFSFNINKYVNK